MQAPTDLDRSALRIAERMIELLDRGGFTATYKYAVLVALIDVCMERVSSTGLPPTMVTTRQLAEKVIELYWPHCAPYQRDPTRDADLRVLEQSTSGARKPAVIVSHILKFREAADPKHERALPLSRAQAMAAPGAFEQLVRDVEWALIRNPLWRLQRVGPEEDRFLYDYAFTDKTPHGEVDRYQRGLQSPFKNTLEFKPGVSEALLALNGVLRPLIYRSWTAMVASMNRIEESRLERFLFGEDRISLDPVRDDLRDLQQGLCFYCQLPITATCHVDHVIPWARHADNSVDNLVVAHSRCNLAKSDFLAAAEHVERWRERSVRHAAALADIARERRWDTHPDRTLSVARAIYGMLPHDARLWRLGGEFVVIDPPRIRGALAA